MIKLTTLKGLKIKGSEEELEKFAKKAEDSGLKTIKLFGDPIIIES